MLSEYRISGNSANEKQQQPRLEKSDLSFAESVFGESYDVHSCSDSEDDDDTSFIKENLINNPNYWTVREVVARTFVKENSTKLLFSFILLGVATFFIIDTFTSQIILGWILQLNIWIKDSGNLGILYLLILLIFVTLSGLPATLFIIGGAFAFIEEFDLYIGMAITIIVSYVGVLIGGSISFLLGRTYFRKKVRHYIRSNDLQIIRAIDTALKTQGFKMAFALRLVPYIPWPVFHYSKYSNKMSTKVRCSV